MTVPVAEDGITQSQPLALIGAAITLPAGIQTREAFFQVIKEKRQLSVDTVAGGRYHKSDYDPDDDHPWKLKNKDAMAFTMDEVISYDYHLCNVQGKLLKTMHVHQLAALQAAFEGLEDAGIPLHDIFKTRTGVFAAAYCPFLPSIDAPDETFLRSSAMSSIADHVSYFLGTHGPSVTLETACSSSLVAMAMAAASLNVGDCDTAIVIGINYLSEKDFHLSLQACGVLVQSDACHPFDEDGPHGFFRAEGMGCVVLRRLKDAEAKGNRVLAKVARAIAASAGAADTSLEGAGRVYEQPCPQGMRQMFIRAYSSAGIPFRRLNYMECHATGTAVGDVIEVDAVGAVFGESHDLKTNPIRIASVKSNIGHAEVAAGIFSVIKVVQMMKHRVFLPTAGVTTPRTDYDWDGHNMRVQQELEPFPENGEPVVVGLSSFGIGGSYGHVIIEEYTPPSSANKSSNAITAGPHAVSADGTSFLLPLSAVSLNHLKLFAERLSTYLTERGDAVALKDLCGTMWVHRSRFKFRKSFIAPTPQAMAQQLAAFAKTGNVQPSGEGRKMQVAYCFTGQGSQYPGVGKSLMGFPVYKKTVEAVDKLFKDLSGWSILEKSETLSMEEMRDTVYAQPISFLVQIGLFELLKFFKVFPDLVLGHSAGEVTAAYAAGLLTLEEAVKVVYHRSAEQQKMAGCGRLLVVGMAHEKVLEYIMGQEDIEVACVNSPESVVLASSEARLNEVKLLFPEGTATTFVQGNIAFHSSRMMPILETMKARLGFLDARGPTGWSLPFVSTVTGKVETQVDAEYWIKNVRYPVLFQKAIEALYSGDTVPDVVLEIGPHQTLVSPIKQILNAAGKSSTVLPTLKKGAPCAVRFLEALGNLFEKGAECDFKPWYAELGYQLEEDMPKHPFIRKPLYEVFPTMRFDMRFGQYHDGPVAGRQRQFDGAFLVEVSDRTFKGMLDHKMGGKTIVPGMFFVEMALEASRQLPVTLANVEFKSMLRIPTASKGEIPLLVGLQFQDVKDEVRSFVVTSTPLRDKMDEDPVYVTHCTGLSIKSKLLNEDGSLRPGFKPEAFGIMGGLELEDLDEGKLKALVARHSDCKHVSKEAFYGHHCIEGVMEWLGGFQLIQSAHLDPETKTILSKIRYDNAAWAKKGGVFGIEFLDSVIHPLLMLADDSAVYYAGGFDAGHFLRQPQTEELFAYLIPDKSRMIIGRKQKIGDFAVYDATGRLCIYIQGFFSIIGSVIDNYKLCDLLWQPYQASLTPQVNTPLALTNEAWSEEKNEALTSYLADRLWASGALEPPATAPADAVPANGGLRGKGPAAPPLFQQVKEAIVRFDVVKGQAGAAEPALPGAAHLAEHTAAALAASLVSKVQPAAAGEAKEEGPAAVTLTGEDVAELVAAATFQEEEARGVARALKARIEANQAAFGQNYVFRVLELAEDKVETVFEALNELELPESVTVEFFVGSFNSGLLMSLASKSGKRAANIRFRRVLLSEKVHAELKDITFDALCLADWARSGAQAFAEGPHAAAASNAMAFLAPFLVPGAGVFVRGLGDLPLWVTLASQLSSAALPLLAAAPGAGKAAVVEWTSALTTYGEGKPTVTGPVLVARYKGWDAGEHAGRFLLVVDSAAEGAKLQARLKEVNPACDSEMVLIGPGATLTDESTVEDYIALVNTPGVGADAASYEDSEYSEITTDSSTATTHASGEADAPGARLPFKGVVFMAGLHDDSVIAEKAFSRLLKLSQALLKSADKPKSLWLVTNGVYVGEIKPAQGAIQGFSTVLKSELSGLATKHVDLASIDTGLLPLARLVVADAHEVSYSVTEQGKIQVPRFNAVDKVQARAERVAANDPKVSFFADPEKQNTPGKIGVKFRLQEVPLPQADEVQVEVYAAALNFRDVMIALSLLPEKSYEASFYGKNLGLEGAGVVTHVGRDVTNLKVGDRVLLNEPRTFCNRLNAPAYRVVPFSGLNMSFEDAASIQSVYNTSHHALINLARIRKGETVLIHSAAGGIGHAAISIAKHVGAVIYATAGSEEKRQLVRDMGVTHVYNSRDISWFDDLMKDTGGKGVDVILNSLAGKHQRLGIQALRSSGRFLEIGKMDIFDNNGLDLLAFRKNISFFAIDMDRMVLDNPQLAAEVAHEVGKQFEAGNYDLIPHQVFPMDDIKAALDLMKTGKHVGKVVLSNYAKKADGTFEPLAVTVEKPQQVFRANASYLFTGGAGGFGSAMVRYAFDHGAKHFLITTRSADTEKVKASFSDITKHQGVTFEVMTVDTGKEADVKALLDKARKMSPPVKSIFHVAGISVDVLLPEMKPENYPEVADCKARGAWFLHQHSLDMDLEHFVCVSSIAALIGGPGMASYSSANAYLDALMRFRRQQGLPGTTFNMASLSDVGILKNNLSARKFQLKVGMEFMSSTRAMETLVTGLVVGMNPVVTMFFKEQTRDMFPSQAAWSHQLGEAISLGAVAASSSFMTAKEIAAFLADEIRAITGVQNVLVTAQLTALGLDSLGFVELGGRMKKSFNIEMDSVKMSPDMTLEDVAKMIYKLQARSGAGGKGEGASTEAAEEVVVLHSKAEMNSMISSRFDPAAENQKPSALRKASSSARLLAAPTNLVRAVSGLRGARVLIFGAEFLNGAHMVRYLLKAGAAQVLAVGPWTTAEGGLLKIQRGMEELGIWKKGFAKRMRAIPGDVAKAEFGLKPDAYEELVQGVDAIVHTGGSLKWAMDADLVPTNINGLMNVIALARKNGASVHYLSSSSLTAQDCALEADKALLRTVPYFDVKRKAEDILQFAARHYGLRCLIYRLPFISANSRALFGTGYAKDLILVRLLQCIQDSGLLPQELAQQQTHIISADAAAKFVVGHMRSNTPLTAPGQALWRKVTIESEAVKVAKMANWVEALKGGQVDRTASVDKFKEYLEKRFRPEIGMIYSSLFFDIMPALSRGGALATDKDAEKSSLLQQALRRANRPRTRMGSVEALKAYVTKASADVFAIEESYLRSVGEEAEEELPVVEEEEAEAEAATAVAVAP